MNGCLMSFQELLANHNFVEFERGRSGDTLNVCGRGVHDCGWNTSHDEQYYVVANVKGKNMIYGLSYTRLRCLINCSGHLTMYAPFSNLPPR